MTALDRLTRFERFCARIPERQNAREVVAELEEIAKGLRGRAGPSTFAPFPDPEGEDRDERRGTIWDLTR